MQTWRNSKILWSHCAGTSEGKYCFVPDVTEYCSTHFRKSSNCIIFQKTAVQYHDLLKANFRNVVFFLKERLLTINNSTGSWQITELWNTFYWKGPFEGHLIQPLCTDQGHLSLHQVSYSPIQPDIECWQLGHLPLLCQHVPMCYHCHHKNFFLIPTANLPSFSLKALPFVVYYKPSLNTGRPH